MGQLGLLAPQFIPQLRTTPQFHDVVELHRSRGPNQSSPRSWRRSETRTRSHPGFLLQGTTKPGSEPKLPWEKGTSTRDTTRRPPLEHRDEFENHQGHTIRGFSSTLGTCWDLTTTGWIYVKEKHP
eukprot:scaffold1318_cov362-Pavlova_lutheri.AAC.30